MSEPFIGEIKLMAFNFAPQGWLPCNGQTLSIMQNQALYALIGTTYGGDGQTTFRLPDLRGRAAMHRSASHPIGQTGGQEAVTLTLAEVPGTHTHDLLTAAADGSESSPVGHALARGAKVYLPLADDTASTTLSPAAVTSTGGEAHENRQPYLTVAYCIATQGIFPSRD